MKSFVLLQVLFLPLQFSPVNSVCQEKLILKQEDLPDFKLAYQSIHEGRIYQQWDKIEGNYSLYLYYYEYKDDYTSIKEISDRSGSLAALYIFGFPMVRYWEIRLGLLLAELRLLYSFGMLEFKYLILIVKL